MSATSPKSTPDLAFYERAAQEFYDSLPLEHFMESTPQQMQRKITLASFELIHAALPKVWCYNELLIQYPNATEPRQLERVVPDNLIVIHREEISGTGSFNTPYERARLFMALEYAGASSAWKDTVANIPKYNELGLPYYLIFHTEYRRIQLLRWSSKFKELRGTRANAAGRYSIPQIELEVGMYDDWMRFWFRGRMLPLPAELAEQVDYMAEKLDQAEAEIRKKAQALAQAEAELRKMNEAQTQAVAEIASLKAALARLEK